MTELLDSPFVATKSPVAAATHASLVRVTTRSAPRRTLLLVDGQNDFAALDGSLTSPGADEAMRRVAHMLIQHGGSVDDLFLTFDQHPRYHIGHARWFVTADGQNPDSFTPITYEDYTAGRWFCYSEVFQHDTAQYLKALEAAGKVHRVWPEHCVFGTPGGNLFPPLDEAVCRWEVAHKKNARKFIKGENPQREHFSAIECDVPDTSDPATQVNHFLLSLLCMSDEVGVAGLIKWPCVGETLRSILRHKPDLASRLVLLIDGTVDGVGLEAIGQAVVDEVTAQGVRLSTTTKWLV